MRDETADYELVARWRGEPHVHEWWDPDLPVPTMDSVRSEYRLDLQPESPDMVCIVEFEGRPIGFVQFYPWSAYQEELRDLGRDLLDASWGLDLFIGESDSLGQGIGPSIIDLVCRHLFEERGASVVVLWTAMDNHRAVRAYEKARFERIGEVLDTDTKRGQRVLSLVMARRPPTPAT